MNTFIQNWVHFQYIIWGTQAIFKSILQSYSFLVVVAQTYNTDARKIHVILGNSALVKCDIPSFVADFVSVVSWLDNDGVEYFPSNMGTFFDKSQNGDHTSSIC